jgi:hypothetical protein
VDPRNRMGLDARTPEDQWTVEAANRSKEDFLARIADPSLVLWLRPDSPDYGLKVTPSLHLIDTREGGRIAVEDPVNQGISDLFASTRNDEAKPASGIRSASDRSRRRTSREGAE